MFPPDSSPHLLLAYTYWVHTPHPFLIQFSENIGIRFYGLAYLAGFAAAVGLLYAYHKYGRSPFGLNTITDLITFIVLGVVVGGRLGYFILYHQGNFLDDPFALLRVWEGGMASHGGILGVALAMAWWCWQRKVPFFQIADLVVSVAPAGLLFGRLANFINGELWGKETIVRWAVIFKETGGGVMPRHPSQLYEAALEGALLLGYLQWRIWCTNVTTRNPGRLAGEFLVGYALVRIFCELFREPDAGIDPILGLSRGTFYSLFMILAGLVLILRRPKIAAAS